MIALNDYLRARGVTVSESAALGLKKYREMLIDWNTRMDLTAVSTEDMAARHFMDSLAALNTGLIGQGASLIDVGTGAGFPGLALAIARRDLSVTLLDAQEKRCRFLRCVIEELGIDNARVLNGRAENAGRDPALREAFDLAAARAVAPANVLCEYLLPFVRVGGRALLWKGPAVRDELEPASRAAALTGGAFERLIPTADDNAHVLAVYLKIRRTVPQYPRKNGVPAKKPLGID